ncbi:alkyl sulfatase C-terminal domain-containing protein [Kribbella pittospori]|uniref:alkyl sulfatase C-terminal domain-containing protein n=1 Tax=Kribbella pittospori TaxID=722689 RepID=UPI00192D3156|nr:alkyl sulfatase C-terminal domain-containing protein [Kribbella pittospori]
MVSSAKHALADVYQHLGFGSENPTWRNFCLAGALELREGITPPAMDPGAGMAASLAVEQLFDTIAIRVDGPRAAGESLTIDWQFTDLGKTIRTTLSNGAFIQTRDPKTTAKVDLTATLTKAQLLGMLAGGGLDGIDHSGDPAPSNAYSVSSTNLTTPSRSSPRNDRPAFDRVAVAAPGAAGHSPVDRVVDDRWHCPACGDIRAGRTSAAARCVAGRSLWVRRRAVRPGLRLLS